ncbi:hypothetical protein VCSRO96_2935 [Vibrio cholerae]|uniref:hypothetical protein n=1 Tax=Vibrio cholerae TaxID=666 RepID=UPI000218F989|nr:hypothetical protein [Vibrio cholerae]EKO3443577.1 hypothetical protein [Vibrio fluvialis]EGR09669.1 hypothetical protein VCHE48_0502 [Vibrio cholerae HE48]EII7297957.1 hypothetical protein [Vibrio cholerae]TXY86012.1 hypothetical protein FXE75_04590 [Vibrio cholerae]BCK33115.1 hypothetical protein VCSRO96_2935 [Vibrio cholerae]
MQALKIDNNQGYFLKDDNTYEVIDKLDKTALLYLVNLSLEDDFSIEDYDEAKIRNQAHAIIYKSVSEKLLDLFEKRQQFKDESEGLYREEYEKYSVESL